MAGRKFTQYKQGNGFFVVRNKQDIFHIPLNEVSHLKSGHENHAIVVLKSGQEIETQHWMNRAREMLNRAIQQEG